MGEFASVLNCIDGRVQRRAFDYFVATFRVHHVDTITAPGMVKHVSHDNRRTSQIVDDLRVSIAKHGSTQIGVVAHSDCAGNPVEDEVQKGQLESAVTALQAEFPDFEVVGMFMDLSSIPG